MSFAELLARLGGMGRFQVTYVAALALPLLVLPSHNLLQNFTAGVPEHRCRPRPGANGTVPADGRCRRYAEPPRPLPGANGTAEAPTEPCRDGWVYQEGVFAHTIVTEWDLVCEARSLRQVAQAGYMAGVLLGSGVFGILSDKFGRRALLIWCYLQLGVTGTGAALAPSFGLYCLCRGLAGLAVAGVTLNSASLFRAGGRRLRPPALAPPPARRLPPLLPLLPLLLALRGVGPVAGDFGEAPPGPRGAPQSRPGQRQEGGRRQARRGDAAVAGGPGAGAGGGRPQPRRPGPDPRHEEGLRRRRLHLVLHQLRLLRAGHGPAALRGGRAPGAAALRRRRRPGQAGLRRGPQRRGAAGGAGRGPGSRRALRPRQRPGAPRAADAAPGLRHHREGLPGRLLQLRLHLLRGALPHRHQTGMGLGGTMARVGSMGAPLVGLAADISPALPLVTYGAAALAAAAAAARLLPETRRAPLPETVADVERRAGRLKDEQPQVTVPLAPAEADRGEDGV
ncbi:solute carrier family 22 member 6-like isoform X3 [Dromaius novaehollandiae]|uniref:solute carrier family 22 member 6-like isoform X3 n=1 Tax=Dromaius novaehollandiae TaxID=8790 RepID=UPI00311E248F